MSCQTVNQLDDFAELKESWNRLVDGSVRATIFLRHEWFESWWKAFGEGHKLFVVVSKDERQINGIMPLMETCERHFILPVRKISFIENNEVPDCGPIVNETLDFSGEIQSLFNCVVSSGRQWDVIWLRRMVIDDRMISSIVSYFRERGYPVLIQDSLQSPVLRISGDWEMYYSAKNQRFKKKVRNDLNRLKKHGKVTVDKVTSPGMIQDRMEDVFSVGHRSWKGEERKAIGSTEQSRSFFKGIPDWIASGRNGVVLWTLSLDGKMIAFEYHIRDDETEYALRGEFDENYKTCSPGSVLDSEIVKRLFEDGIRDYNMCGHDAPYKLRWTSDILPHRDLMIFNRTVYGRMLSLVVPHGRPVLKKLVRCGQMFTTKKGGR